MSATLITFADATLTPQTGVSVLTGGTANVITGGAGQNLSLTITDTPVVSIQDTADTVYTAYGIVQLTSQDGTVAITNPSAGVINFEANGVAPGGGKPLATYIDNVVASLGISTVSPAQSPYSLATPALALWQPYPYSVPSASGIGALYMDLTVKWVISTVNPPASVSISVFQSGTATPTDPYAIFTGVAGVEVGTAVYTINSMGAWTMPIENIPNLANEYGAEGATTRTLTQTISGSCRTLVFPSAGYPNIFVMILPTYLKDSDGDGDAPTCSVVFNRFYSP